MDTKRVKDEKFGDDHVAQSEMICEFGCNETAMMFNFDTANRLFGFMGSQFDILYFMTESAVE
jgi:hypothetical protein